MEQDIDCRGTCEGFFLTDAYEPYPDLLIQDGLHNGYVYVEDVS